MESSAISYDKLPKTSALFLDYVYHYDRVSEFYSGSPFDHSSYGNVANQLRHDTQRRNALAEVLTRQNQEFGNSEAALKNIERLKGPATFAVVTGQQVGLLSGPAFTHYKALTAVRLAQSLSDQGLPCVPVFWLATEDHDLEEVASTAVFDEEYNLVELKDSGIRPAPQSHVGQVRLTGEIERTLGSLEGALPPGASRETLLRDLRECYKPDATWGKAFGKFLARIFSKWGVILLDPLDEEIHRLSSSVYVRVIDQTGQLKRSLLQRSAKLRDNGYAAQVHVGEESTLLFLTRTGNRTALEEQEGKFSLDGTGLLSASELKTAASAQPLDFTPNALLRPFVQDSLLPTVAYIAGPSELAYLAQSQVVYSALGRPQPVIFPRAGFTLVDARTHRLMEKYKVTVEDIWRGEEHLRRAIAASGFSEGWSARLEHTEQAFTQLLEQLQGDVAAIDPTLLDPVKHTEGKIKHQLDQLKGKISRAALAKSEMLARHQEALLRFLLPRKHLQEREVSGVYFLGRAGYELLDKLYAQIQTNAANHLVFTY